MQAIEQLLEEYNNGANLDLLAKKNNTSKATIQRYITKHGYHYNKKTKKYEKQENKEQINIVSTKTNTESETMVNRTFAIPETIDKAMKIKAVIENKKNVDILKEALENYIEKKYFNM